MTETARPTLSGLLEQFEAIGGPEEFGPEGIAIMVALWQRSSKLGWRRSFKMTNADLMLRTGFRNRETLNKHRGKLVEAGLIGYVPPPRGSARGDYSIRFDSLVVSEVDENLDYFEGVVKEVDENSDSFNGDNPKVVNKVVQNSDHLQKVVGEVVKNPDTVLKDLSSSTSSTATTGAPSETEPYESFYAAHERVFGFGCNPHQCNVLSKYIDEDGMEEAVVIRALERSALISTGPSFGLITRILNDYLAGRALTLDAAKAFDAAFDAKRASPAYTGPPVRTQQQTRQRQKTNDLQQRLKEEEAREQSGHNATVYRH
ncbi:DnaD domain protein [Paenibacillus polymyxa]|uniref:DnaD domain protein n=1 Tax=Paenibacillus polymyxa TaxID=1406 RepID=UPI00287F9BCF|nr:DnaD domain protein [Paenibacillus polymyxa]